MTKNQTIITSKVNLFNLHLKDIWLYRDLISLIVYRDFVSVYKQTILGPLWYIVQPLLTTIVFSLIFGTVGGLNPSNVPSFLYYLSGIILWNYFADCLIKTSTAFIENQQLLGKVYFPRLVIPISIIISNLIKFIIQFILFLIFFIWYYFKKEIQIQNTILFLPFLLILLALLSLGIGIIISSLTTKYRDLRFLIQFGVQLLMYITPGIIFSYDLIIFKLNNFSFLININPIYPIIETFKHGWLNAGYFSWFSIILSACITTIILITGILIFNKNEKNLIDTI